MTSIQTYKDSIKILEKEIEILEQRLSVCHHNGKIISKMKSNSEQDMYAVMQFLHMEDPDSYDKVMKYVLNPLRSSRESIISSSLDQRSLSCHEARMRASEAFEKDNA